MDILSKHFEVEIAVLHIEGANLVPVNGCGARRRIFLLYDGIHYDSLVFRGFGIPEQRVVAVDDERATQLALDVTRVLRASGAYTNEKTSTMRCDACGRIVKGMKEANEHGRRTGHVSFSQATRN
jgi:ubiquitin thioesterase OTU1